MKPNQTLRVILVEDDPAQRLTLRRFLETRGHSVVLDAERGDDPLIVTTPADAAIVDMGLPGLDGAEVVRILRGRAPAVPVLVLSASAHSAGVASAFLAGAGGYLVKGARLASVVDALTTLVLDERRRLPHNAGGAASARNVRSR